MFTGIIEATGRILSIDSKGDDSRFVFETGKLSLADLKIGDSVAVNGACLTIIEKTANQFTSDLSKETLALTTFSELTVNSRVNLEKAMQLSDRLNGHMVSGHVDGIGEIILIAEAGRSWIYQIETPHELIKFISKKGSITIDGVSLTLNDVDKNIISLMIIPHTQSETIFSEYQVGTKVNLEVDMLARYLDKLIAQNAV